MMGQTRLATRAMSAMQTVSAQMVECQLDGVILRLADAKAGDVRLRLVSEKIVWVSADGDGDFRRSTSLIWLQQEPWPRQSARPRLDEGRLVRT